MGAATKATRCRLVTVAPAVEPVVETLTGCPCTVLFKDDHWCSWLGNDGGTVRSSRLVEAVLVQMHLEWGVQGLTTMLVETDESP